MVRSLCMAILIVAALMTVQLQAAIVTLTGTYPETVIGTADPYAEQSFTFVFETSLDPVPPAIVESESAFIIPVTVTYTNNNTPRLLQGTAAYFNYPTPYTGLDIKLNDWIGSDWIQIVFVSSYSLYAGGSDDPTLLVTQTDGPTHFHINGSLSDNSFTVQDSQYTLVPEPASLTLLACGALAFLARRPKA